MEGTDFLKRDKEEEEQTEAAGDRRFRVSFFPTSEPQLLQERKKGRPLRPAVASSAFRTQPPSSLSSCYLEPI